MPTEVYMAHLHMVFSPDYAAPPLSWASLLSYRAQSKRSEHPMLPVQPNRFEFFFFVPFTSYCVLRAKYGPNTRNVEKQMGFC